MTSENEKWQNVKAEYLGQVEKALSSVKHPNNKEIIEDVRCHLDTRYAELGPDRQSWEDFQAIITEMGPASDYAELLSGQTISAKNTARRRYVLPIAFGAVAVAAIVVAAILLQIRAESQAVNPANAIAEGFEFDDIVLKNPETTKDSVRAKIGQPEKETDNLLDYREQYGLDFFFGGGSVLSEIRLNSRIFLNGI